MVSSVAFAKPTETLDFATMSKTDSQFLFQDGAKVAVLDNTEMEETEGKWVANFISGFISGGAAATGYYLDHEDEESTWEIVKGSSDVFISSFVGGFIAPGYGTVKAAVRTGASYFGAGYFSDTFSDIVDGVSDYFGE